MDDGLRRQTATEIIVGLPVFGAWVVAISEYDTPFGRVGNRQLEILWSLRHGRFPGPPVTPSAIASHLNVQPSVVTRILAKLAAHGFIDRVALTDDRRSSEIRITARGLELSRFVEELYYTEVLAVLDAYSDEEIAHLHAAAVTLHGIGDRLLAGRKARPSLAEVEHPDANQPDPD